MLINVCSVGDLLHIRKKRNLEQVDLHFSDKVFLGNIPIYAIKICLWALKREGILKILAENLPNSVSILPGRLSFQMLLQIIARTTRDIAEIDQVSYEKQFVVIRRVSSVDVEKWSAGIVFSGREAEVEQLEKCVESIRSQPEIYKGGEVVVCGPKDGESLVKVGDGVRYFPYETPSIAGRFLVGKKKNALIRELKNENILICHTRILLNAGALGALPAEFDLITPRVSICGRKRNLPYLDLGFLKMSSLSMVQSGWQPLIFYKRSKWVEHLGSYFPYVDGGLFCVKRSVALSEPLSDQIAWGEGEDAEWSLRLLCKGYLVELCNDANAKSATCKIRFYEDYGHLKVYRLANSFRKALHSFFTR